MLTKKNSRSSGLLLIAAILIGGSMIALSQADRPEKAEVSSPTALRQPPEKLRFPRVPPNRESPREKDDLPQGIPPEVTYRQIFKHIEELDIRADKEKQKGRNGEKFRLLYKRMAGLDERQAQMLDRIAKNTNRELKQLDDRARKITQQ
ncbi:MAG: hypothetical protein KDB79_16775, partial [Acidobacteria bacterium]|nr:hypothetical protein [Acidobacteriota bacterium]